MRVDYYLLDQSAPQMIVNYTCRLLMKAYDAGMRVFVLADSEAQSTAIDQQLWRSSDTNFIPHAVAGSAAANSQLSKIQIGLTLSDVSGFDFLVNLGCQDDIQSKDFSRIAELVSADPTHKQAARKRYAAWRDAGADLNTHNIQIT